MKMSLKQYHLFKDFQSDQIQRSSLKIFTAHYTSKNADLNLTLVMGTTNRLFFENNLFINRILRGTLDLP